MKTADPTQILDNGVDDIDSQVRTWEAGAADDNVHAYDAVPRDADAPGYMLDDDAFDDHAAAGRPVNIREFSTGEDYTPASSDLFRDGELDENNQSEADTGATVDTTGPDAELASDGMDQGVGDTNLITTDAPD